MQQARRPRSVHDPRRGARGRRCRRPTSRASSRRVAGRAGDGRTRAAPSRPRARPSRICAAVARGGPRPLTTRSTPWRRSSTTTQNPYVQLPCRSRTGRSPFAATSPWRGPTMRPSTTLSRPRARPASPARPLLARGSRPGSPGPTRAAHAPQPTRAKVDSGAVAAVHEPAAGAARGTTRMRRRHPASVWRTGPRVRPEPEPFQILE